MNAANQSHDLCDVHFHTTSRDCDCHNPDGGICETLGKKFNALTVVSNAASEKSATEL
jgi:hypothetical protein